MPKNITISIPDSLHVALKETKGEFPISQTCAKALQDQIDGIDQFALKAKIRFACFDLADAKLLAYNEGLRWAAEDASIAQIIFISCFEEIATIERYAEYSDELRQIFDNYSKNSLMEYFVSEISCTIPDHIISRFMNDDNEDIYIAVSFFDGVKTIWKRIAQYADQEIKGTRQGYIFKELRG